MLVSLTYTSQATSPLSEDSLKLLVDSAAAKNKVLDVTGALVYLNGTIVQTLEGRMATVTKLYNRVAKDRRHERVTLVLVRSLKEREYGSWGMIQATLGDSSEVHSVLRSMMLTMRAAFDVVDRYVQPAVTSLLRRAIEPSEVEAEVGDSCILVAGITGLRQDNVLPFTTSDFVSACGAFYDVVVEHVARAGGDVVKFAGDCVMCSFPIYTADAALECAKAIVRAMSRGIAAPGRAAVDVRVSIAAGSVIRGNIGHEGIRYDYTLLGEPADTAARLCSIPLDERGCVVVTDEFLKIMTEYCGPSGRNATFEFLPLENTRLKGKDMNSPLHYIVLNRSPTVTRKIVDHLGSATGKTDSDVSLISLSDRTDVQLIRLSYVSHAVKFMSGTDLQELARAAAENNQRLGITGALLSFDGIFFQVLEGNPKAIWKLMDKIGRDPRHRDVTTVVVEKTDERKYGDWNMRGFDIGDATDFAVVVARRMLKTTSRAFKAIERYAPPKVLKLMVSGVDPARVKPVTTQTIVLATNLVEFSTIVESIDPKDLLLLVNLMLRIVLTAIEDHGGSTSKIVGDRVIAHFPASAAHEAVMAALEIQHRMGLIRSRDDDAHDGVDASLIHCGVGLASGQVIEANVGKRRLDMTLIGACVEEAIAAEVATRLSKSNILMTSVVAALVHESQGPASHVKTVETNGFVGIANMDDAKWNHAFTVDTIRARLEARRAQ